MAKRKTPNASGPVSFKQAAGLALELLTDNVARLIKMRYAAKHWNEGFGCYDTDTHMTMLTVADMLENLRTKSAMGDDTFSYELGKIASLVTVAKAAYSREDPGYFYALSYTNAAFLVMMEMVELAELGEDPK